MKENSNKENEELNAEPLKDNGRQRYIPDLGKANEAIKRNGMITNSQREEAITLFNSGISVPEIMLTLSLSESQVYRALKWAESDRINREVAESVQVRKIGKEGIQRQSVELSNKVQLRVIKRIADLVDTEEDISKLSTALKVLNQIVSSAEVVTEVKQTLTRLRGV